MFVKKWCVLRERVVAVEIELCCRSRKRTVCVNKCALVTAEGALILPLS
jgi:hypothetical protein